MFFNGHSLSHFLPGLFHCPSHSGIWLLELGLFTGGSCFCQVGRTRVKNVLCFGVHSGEKLILFPLLFVHTAFLGLCCPTFVWHNCLFKMLVLPYGGRKLPLWNEASHAIFSRKEFISEEERNVDLLWSTMGYFAWLGLGLLFRRSWPQTCS